MKNLAFSLIFILTVVFINSSDADTLYWTGNAGDNDWFNQQNWSPQQVPTSSDDLYFPNPPNSNLTVEIDNATADCQNLYLQDSGYTLSITGNNAVLNVSNDLICFENNTVYNRAEVNVAHDMTVAGILDNNFGGDLMVNNILTITSTGYAENSGNGSNTSLITALDIVNDGMIENENQSQITVTNSLTNNGDFTNYNFATLEVQTALYNHGLLHNNKKTDLVLSLLFENYNTFISEDHATLHGSGGTAIYNWGSIQNIDHSDLLDVLNVFNYGTISNQNKGEFYVLNNIESDGTINNDFYIEVGMDFLNFNGSSLGNTDEILCNGNLYSDGSIDNQDLITVNGDLQIDVNGNAVNSGCFTVNTNTNIEGQYTGSLLNYGTITGSGVYTYNRNTGGTGQPGAFNGWHYVSTPVGDMSCHDIYDYWINDWDETQNTWYNYSPSGSPCVAGPDNPFENGKGYSIKRDLEYMCGAVNPPTGAVVEFTGIAGNTHTGVQSIQVTGTGFEPGDPNDLNNWNLVGNPYPSVIDANQITFPAQIDNAIYYYDDAGLSYETFVGGVGQPFIPITQGFFVHVNTAGSWQLNLDNSVRTCNGEGFWYKNDIPGLVRLDVTAANGLSDKTWIRKLEDATKLFDKQWDAYKLLSDLPEVPQIYSLTNDTKYSINTQDELTMIPLVFKSGGEEYYTLTASGVSDFSLVYLEDKSTGILQDLKANPVYSFYAQKGESSARFVLHFDEYAKSLARDGFIIYSKGKNIYVKNLNNQPGTVEIMNLLGQRVTGLRLQDGLNRIPMERESGIYLVRVNTQHEGVMGKVYLQ